MIVVIDNYDSFTWNLVDLLRRGKQVVTVYRNDETTADDLLALSPKGILLSPGPGRPDESGISLEVLVKAAPTIPILGVCLGHQLIGQYFGMQLKHSPEPVHGKTHPVFHHNQGLFEGMSIPFAAMRYHSLVLSAESIPSDLEVTAWTETGEVMGIRHKNLHVQGIQFHPESILTEGGDLLLQNWTRQLVK